MSSLTFTKYGNRLLLSVCGNTCGLILIQWGLTYQHLAYSTDSEQRKIRNIHGVRSATLLLSSISRYHRSGPSFTKLIFIDESGKVCYVHQHSTSQLHDEYALFFTFLLFRAQYMGRNSDGPRALNTVPRA